MKNAEKQPKKDMYDIKVKPYLDEIKRYMCHGVTEGQICDFYGIGRTAWAEYKKKHSELTETLYHARETCKTELINRAYEVAVGYNYDEVTTVEYVDKNGCYDGGKTTTVKRYAKADGGMLQFLLINRFSDEFARDPQVLEIRKELLEIKKKLADNGGGMEGI